LEACYQGQHRGDLSMEVTSNRNPMRSEGKEKLKEKAKIEGGKEVERERKKTKPPLYKETPREREEIQDLSIRGRAQKRKTGEGG